MKTWKYSIYSFISKSEEMIFKKLIIVFVLCILIFNAAAIIKEAYANNNNSSSSNQVTIVQSGRVYAKSAPTNQDIISMCAGLKALLQSNEQVDKNIYGTFLKEYNTNCTTVLGTFQK